MKHYSVYAFLATNLIGLFNYVILFNKILIYCINYRYGFLNYRYNFFEQMYIISR